MFNKLKQKLETTPGGVALNSTPSPIRESGGRMSRTSSISSLASDMSYINVNQLIADLPPAPSDVEWDESDTDPRVSSASRKYRTILASYRQLERQHEKMKNALVQSQDKAFQKITELKDQLKREKVNGGGVGDNDHKLSSMSLAERPPSAAGFNTVDEELAHTKERIRRLETLLQRCRDSIQQSKVEKDKTSDECQQLKLQVIEQTKELADAHGRIEETTTSCDHDELIASLRADLQKSHSELTSSRTALEQKVALAKQEAFFVAEKKDDELNKMYNTLQEKYETLLVKGEEVQQEVEHLRVQLADRDSKLASLAFDRSEAVNNLAAAKKLSLEEVRMEHDSEITSLRLHHETEMEEMRRTQQLYEEQRKLATSLSSQLLEAAASGDTYKAQMEKTAAELTQARGWIEEMRSTGDDLSVQLADCRQEVDRLKLAHANEITSLAERHQKVLEDSLILREQEAQDSEAKLAESDGLVAALRKEGLQSAKTNEVLSEKLDELHNVAEAKSSLSSRLSEERAEAALLRQQVAELMENNASFTSLNAALEEDLRQAKESMSGETSSLTAELEKVRQQLKEQAEQSAQRKRDLRQQLEYADGNVQAITEKLTEKTSEVIAVTEKLSAVTATLATATEDREALQIDLQACRQANEGMLKQQREEAEVRLSAVADQLQTAVDELAGRRSELEQSQKLLLELQAGGSNLAVEVKQVTERCGTLEADLASAHKAKVEADAALDRSTAELAAVREWLEEVTHERDDVAQQLAVLQAESEVTKVAVEELHVTKSEVATLSAERHERETALKTELESHSTQASALKTQVSQLELQLMAAELSAGAAERDALELKSQCEELSSKLLAEERSAVELGLRLEEVEVERDQAQTKVSELTSQLAETSAAVQTARAALEKLQSAESHLRAELGEKAVSEKEMKAELERLRSGETEAARELNSQLSFAVEQCRSLETTRVTLENELTARKEELSSLNESYSSLETSLQLAIKSAEENKALLKVETERSTSFERRCLNLTTQGGELESTVQEGVAEIKQLQSELKVKGEKVTESAQRLSSLSSELAALSESSDCELQLLRVEVESSESRVSHLTAALKGAQEELDSARGCGDQMRRDAESASSELAASQQRISELAAEVAALQEKNTEHEQRFGKLKIQFNKKLKCVTEEKNELEKTLRGEQTDEARQYTDQLSELRVALESKEEELDNTQLTVAQLERKVGALETEAAQLSAQHQDKQSSLQQQISRSTANQEDLERRLRAEVDTLKEALQQANEGVELDERRRDRERRDELSRIEKESEEKIAAAETRHRMELKRLAHQFEKDLQAELTQRADAEAAAARRVTDPAASQQQVRELLKEIDAKDAAVEELVTMYETQLRAERDSHGSERRRLLAETSDRHALETRALMDEVAVERKTAAASATSLQSQLQSSQSKHDKLLLELGRLQEMLDRRAGGSSGGSTVSSFSSPLVHLEEGHPSKLYLHESAEYEYLKNVLLDYMRGSDTTVRQTLSKVIGTVMHFSEIEQLDVHSAEEKRSGGWKFS